MRDAFNDGKERRRRIFARTKTCARLEKLYGKLAKVKGEVAKYGGNEARTVDNRVDQGHEYYFIVNYYIYTNALRSFVIDVAAALFINDKARVIRL